MLLFDLRDLMVMEVASILVFQLCLEKVRRISTGVTRSLHEALESERFGVYARGPMKPQGLPYPVYIPPFRGRLSLIHIASPIQVGFLSSFMS